MEARYRGFRSAPSTGGLSSRCCSEQWRVRLDVFQHQVGSACTALKGKVLTSYRRVDKVEKTSDGKWKVDTSWLTPDGSAIDSTNTEVCCGNPSLAPSVLLTSRQLFDAVVVANGNYHATNIPNIPGLADWQRRFPTKIRHSKSYRTSEGFNNQNVLLIGAGVSSMDIARDLGQTARAVFQSSRGGAYDLSSVLLPENGARVDGIESFGDLEDDVLAPDGSLPGTITLRSGKKLCGIHQVILCTGYHVSFPFLRQLHADGLQPEEANEEVSFSWE